MTIISNSVRVERMLMMGTFGLSELVLVVAVVALLFFGVRLLMN